MSFIKHNAIRNKYPNAVNIIGDKAYDKDNNLLTLDEALVKTEEDKLQAEYDALEYQRQRKREYPTIEELVVALYDTDDKADIEPKRAAVKAKYPKPA